MFCRFGDDARVGTKAKGDLSSKAEFQIIDCDAMKEKTLRGDV